METNDEEALARARIRESMQKQDEEIEKLMGIVKEFNVLNRNLREFIAGIDKKIEESEREEVL